MKSRSLRGRTAVAVLGGSVLCAASVAAGCDPCAWPGAADSCDACVYMPDPPEVTATIPHKCEGRQKWITHWGPSCPPVYDDSASKELWTGEQLFPGFGGTISQYCVYEWTASDGEPPGEQIDTFEMAGASASCAFVEPQQADPIAIELQEELLDAVSGTRASAQDGRGLLARVFVLDTAPKDAELPSPSGASPHGVTLKNLIRDVACGKPACDDACEEPVLCAVDVQTRLVMPWHLEKIANQWTPTTNEAGGQFGRLVDVVQAIGGELFEYRAALLGAASGSSEPGTATPVDVPVRRFYNASFKLGDCEGDGACSDDPPTSLKGSPALADVSAVFDAYLAAACTGVFHVAAAGNSRGAGSPEGLVCPARWDDRVKPTIEICKQLLGDIAFDEMQESFNMVMHAKLDPHGADPARTYTMFDEGDDALLSVGGVDYEGRPLVMSRSGEGSCPEAVALGLGGVGADTDDPQDLPPFLHGTSVSAAIATASLAAEATLGMPTVKAVSEILTARMWGVGATSPIGPVSEKTPIFGWRGRARTPCGELFTGGVGCAPPWIGAPNSPYSGQNFDLPGSLLGALDTTTPGGPEPWELRLHPAPVCTAGIPHCARERVAAPCSTWPQPTEPLCFRCGVTLGPSSPDEQMLTFWSEPVDPASAFDDLGILSAALVIEDGAGEQILTTEIDVEALQSAHSVTKISVPATMTFVGTRAWISAYSEKGSYTQQVFVFK